MFEKTKLKLKEFTESGIAGFDIAVMQNGELKFRYMGGYRDIEKTVPMDGHETYNIYSCSKPITCTAALQLFEKGKFSLDDKVSKFLPEYENLTVKTENGIKKAENPLLLRHLFTMTSGLNYDVYCKSITDAVKKNPKAPTREIIGALAKEPLDFEPGTKWQYSLSHDVLACIVEVISGERFADYVKNHIFAPCGMENSTYSLPESKLSGICPQYNRDENGNYVRVSNEIQFYKFGSEYDCGGAGCVTTLDDYMKFLEALRTGKLINNETLDLMSTDMVEDYKFPKEFAEMAYGNRGYGLGVRCKRGTGDDFTEFGWNGAAGAMMSCDRVKNITIFYAQHYLSSGVDHKGLYKAILEDLGEI